MYSHTILFQPARDMRIVREALHTLEQLRAGWRPDRDTLAAARHVERWIVNRDADAPVYQFLGQTGPPGRSSLVVGTLLAIALNEGWAFLAGNSWVALGRASSDAPPVDPVEVRRRAEIWLRGQQY
jgi:hypothetical protein